MWRSKKCGIFSEWKYLADPGASWARSYSPALTHKSHSHGGCYIHQHRPSSALLISISNFNFYFPLPQQIERGIWRSTKYGILSERKHLGHPTLQRRGRKKWRRFLSHESFLSDRMSRTFTRQKKSCWFHLIAPIRVFPALNPRLRSGQRVS